MKEREPNALCPNSSKAKEIEEKGKKGEYK